MNGFYNVSLILAKIADFFFFLGHLTLHPHVFDASKSVEI